MYPESLIVIEGVGIQTKTTFLSGRSQTRFIDDHKINEVIINEGISGFQVIFYLAVMLQDSDEMVVVFPVCVMPIEKVVLL
jgi:hypothetical protein